jgi:dihydropyrimidinase
MKCVATDEVCCPLEVKLKGSRIDDVMGGNSGVEPRVSLMYTQMVRERGFSLEEFVALVSSNAAKIMGLYPCKGALAVGSDADIVLLDPRRSGPIHKENMHESDYTPWEDWDAAVWPSMTIQRGKVVVEDGKLLAALSDGQFVPRKISDEIRGRPAL